VTLAERWNGISWTVQSTPNPAHGDPGSERHLNAVSCTSSGVCTAVGYYFDRPHDVDLPIAERYA
jgi:hypothetical protein